MKTHVCPSCSAILTGEEVVCPICGWGKDPQPAEAPVAPPHTVLHHHSLDALDSLDPSTARTTVLFALVAGIVVLLLVAAVFIGKTSTAFGSHGGGGVSVSQSHPGTVSDDIALGPLRYGARRAGVPRLSAVGQSIPAPTGQRQQGAAGGPPGQKVPAAAASPPQPSGQAAPPPASASAGAEMSGAIDTTAQGGADTGSLQAGDQQSGQNAAQVQALQDQLNQANTALQQLQASPPPPGNGPTAQAYNQQVQALQMQVQVLQAQIDALQGGGQAGGQP